MRLKNITLVIGILFACGVIHAQLLLEENFINTGVGTWYDNDAPTSFGGGAFNLGTTEITPTNGTVQFDVSAAGAFVLWYSTPITNIGNLTVVNLTWTSASGSDLTLALVDDLFNVVYTYTLGAIDTGGGSLDIPLASFASLGGGPVQGWLFGSATTASSITVDRLTFAIPEPSTYVLVGLGGVYLCLVRRRKVTER